MAARGQVVERPVRRSMAATGRVGKRNAAWPHERKREMETIEQKTTPALSWVTAAGGPELQCEDGRAVIGMPEPGWWIPCYAHDREEIHLHLDHTEPVTGIKGTLLIELQKSKSSDDGINWSSCFLFYTPAQRSGCEDDAHIPVRARGNCATFNQAHAAALAWRPAVEVIDGVELWMDPSAGRGVAKLAAGDLEWRKWDDGYSWVWELIGLPASLRSLRGTSPSTAQMLIDADAAREELRAGLRKFLLNF